MNERIPGEDLVEISVGGRQVFVDTRDHWENALLRLMGMTDEDARSFIGRAGDLAAASPDLETIGALQGAWIQQELPLLNPPNPRPPAWSPFEVSGTQWLTYRIRDSREVGLATDRNRVHGWLADLVTGEAVTPEEVDYEVDYFEGGRSDLGYGSYLAQSPWRMEKARRQCREVASLRRFVGQTDDSLRVLDVGSGYGYFLGAAALKGWSCEGIEISNHAADISEELVGLRPFVGTLEEFARGRESTFDVIVMWDFIEHVEDPAVALATAFELLDDCGTLFLRTPNLNAIEFEVFGADYHSLKREHVNMFSPESLSRLLVAAGLDKPLILSEGHLLSGFVGLDMDSLAAVQRGSDLLAMAMKPSQG